MHFLYSTHAFPLLYPCISSTLPVHFLYSFLTPLTFTLYFPMPHSASSFPLLKAGHPISISSDLPPHCPSSVHPSTLSTLPYSQSRFRGCPKSHQAKLKVQAYCSACDHLIRKFSSGMFHKSSSSEEFNGVSEIDVHFLNERSFFTFFTLLTCLDHISFELLLFGPTIYEVRMNYFSGTFPKKFCGSDDHSYRPSNKPEPLHNDFWDTLYILSSLINPPFH